jgi:hypothetical protein
MFIVQLVPDAKPVSLKIILLLTTAMAGSAVNKPAAPERSKRQTMKMVKALFDCIIIPEKIGVTLFCL